MSKLIHFETKAEFENYITSNSGLPFEEALNSSSNGVWGSVVLIKDTGEIYANNKLQETSTGGTRPVYVTEEAFNTGLNTKQNKITDLADIRAGAALGATSLQTHQDISGKLDKSEASNTYLTKNDAASGYASKTDITNMISGNGTVTNVVKVSSLPSNPDSNTLYVIVE